MLIDQYLPVYDFFDTNRIVVNAHPDEAYAAIRRIDGYRIWRVRALFRLRTLVERIANLTRKDWQQPHSATLTIDDIVAPGSGFMVLEEKPGHEIVVGSVGKFWNPIIQFETIKPEDFAAFSRADFGKLAWNVAVQPRTKSQTIISFEVRVAVPDKKARRRFRRYWWLIGPFSHAIRDRMLKLVKTELEERMDYQPPGVKIFH